MCLNFSMTLPDSSKLCSLSHSKFDWLFINLRVFIMFGYEKGSHGFQAIVSLTLKVFPFPLVLLRTTHHPLTPGMDRLPKRHSCCISYV